MAAAIVSRARAIRSAASRLAAAFGPFVAPARGTERAPGVWRGGFRRLVFRDFLAIFVFPDRAPLAGRPRSRKPRNNVARSRVWRRCNWDRGRYSPREFALDRPDSVLTPV